VELLAARAQKAVQRLLLDFLRRSGLSVTSTIIQTCMAIVSPQRIQVLVAEYT